MGIRRLCLPLLFLLWDSSVAALSLNWETIELPTDEYLYSIFPTESGFVAVGREGTVLRSSNGRHWTPVPIPSQQYLVSGIESNGRWIVVGDGSVWYSDDQGRNWQQGTIPPVNDREFRPFQAEMLHGRLLVYGYLGGTCLVGVAESEDGVHWLSAPAYLFGIVSNIAVSRHGAVSQTDVRGPPCVVMPTLGPPDVFYTPDPTDWSDAINIGQIEMRDSGLHGVLWLDDRLLAISESWNTSTVQLEYHVREVSPGQSLGDVDPVLLDERPLAIGRYGDKPVISHQGAISFRNDEGIWQQRPLPVNEVFRFTYRDQILVGLSPSGTVIRGAPPAAFAVPATGLFGLAMLVVLLFGIAARHRTLSR